MAYTGVAACNAVGRTSNSILYIRPKMPFAPLQGETLLRFQREMERVEYVLIHEYSMVGCKLLGYIDLRLREGKPECDEPFGGCHVYLSGDIRQLPPIGDPALYTRVGTSPEAQRGILAYRAFQKAFILTVTASER